MPKSAGWWRDFAPSWQIPDGGEEVLTHLDLHAGNALRTSDGRKAIDPKGVCRPTAARRLEHYADAAEMDPAKAREWTRIRAGAEAGEVGDDSAWAGALRRMADALD